jgi:O-antigen/teichoic acid export membrane protein
MQEQNNSISNNNQERILKNAGYLTAAFILQKILSFLYFVYISRIIGPVDLGLYDPAKSLIPIFLIIIDFSLSVVLVREIARKPEKVEDYLSSILGIKIIFALVILLGMGLFTNLSNYPILTKTVLYLDGMIVALDTFTLTFFAVFRGIQNMKFEALGMIITQFFTVVVGVIGLRLGYDLRILFFAVLAGSIFNFFYSYTLLRKKLHIRVKLAWDRGLIKSFLRTALPFAISAMLVKVYSYADRYLLFFLVGQGSVGWYVVANKFTYALEFIPSAFSASIFPAMSAFYISSKEKLVKTFEKAMYYLMILAVPISFGILVLADKIVISLSGPAYGTSVVPLRILISGLIVIFLNFPVGALLNACNKQKINMINMAIVVVINIVLNLSLIKHYTIRGTAFAALISGIILFSLGLRQVGKIIDYNKKYLLKMLLKIVTSAGLMALVLEVLKKYSSLTVNFGTSPIMKNVSTLGSLGLYFGIGAIVYIVTLFLLKGFTIEDFKFLYGKFIKKQI